ncbi:MAG TPA: YncE family protein [Solirubrobacterales bacterium]|nr:YncE family protein [Solirubrobacterales bacterium]
MRPTSPRSRLALACLAALALGGTAIATAGDRAQAAKDRKVEVIFVGSNWDGTVEVVEGDKPYNRIARLNAVPDLEERLAAMDPVQLIAFYVLIRNLGGEGHDQLVDDMYSSRDGRLLVVSRPSLADVVGLDLATGEVVWRFPMEGLRADHMGMSPDGREVAVSDFTANKVHILDVKTGRKLGEFESGDSPHENTYSDDGERIYHASIGLVYTPTDRPVLDTTKGDRYFQVVDADTGEIIKRVDMGQKLAEAGYPDMSSAVRPMAVTHDERFVYLQVSFFHGYVKYDLRRDRVVEVVRLPIADHIRSMPRENYLLDSAHHGIAINGANTKLCVAGTMSDYAAIVPVKTGKPTIIDAGLKPYWATTTSDGKNCLVSWSGSDRVSVISYRKRKIVADFRVGDHPQRVRMGYVRRSFVRAHR